jgi:hypothetical protein
MMVTVGVVLSDRKLPSQLIVIWGYHGGYDGVLL